MDLRQGIIDTAGALGVSPLDLATVISYETGGTFDPAQPGPTTQFGQHRGLIQFGEPQAKQHGVDWNNAAASQLGPEGAIASYMRGAGVQPGMGLLDLYSAVNAGRVGRYNASDAHNGGAWGTVADKVNHQMGGHKKKAAALLGGEFKVAQDTMKALGRAPTQSTSQPMVSTRSAPMQAAPEEEKLLGGFLSKDKRDYLIMALEGMTLNPNKALMAQAAGNIKDRRDTKKEKAQRNKTAEWLRSRGQEQLASAVESGVLDGKSAMKRSWEMADAAGSPDVQSVQELPDGGAVYYMRDGSMIVRDIRGNELTGEDAADYVRQAQEYGADVERRKYGARREGTLSTDIELGGQAEQAKQEGKMRPEMAKEYMGQADLVRSNITNLSEAIAAIDEGAESGIVYNMLPNVTEASASLNNAMNRMGLDVIGSVTFGALSEGEMRLAMETAVPRNLGPQELRSWLVKKRDAQRKAVEALDQAALWFAGGGTMEEWLEKKKGGQTSQNNETGGQKKRMKWNPETGRLE